MERGPRSFCCFYKINLRREGTDKVCSNNLLCVTRWVKRHCDSVRIHLSSGAVDCISVPIRRDRTADVDDLLQSLFHLFIQQFFRRHAERRGIFDRVLSDHFLPMLRAPSLCTLFRRDHSSSDARVRHHLNTCIHNSSA